MGPIETQALAILDDMAAAEVAAQARRAVKLGSYEWKADATSLALTYVGTTEAVIIVYPGERKNGRYITSPDFEVNEEWVEQHIHEWEPLDIGAGTRKCECGEVDDPFKGL